MRIIISKAVAKKLAEKHRVSRSELEQCFENKVGGLLLDTREEHLTDPPTVWFLSETDAGRKLKVVYVQRGQLVFVKTAYDANEAERKIYKEKFGV